MIEVIEYTSDWKEQWDDFVSASNNGTMFHMQKFFDYHEDGKFIFHHLIFTKKNKIIALLPGAVVGDTYESPIGASYGSIVTKDISFAETLDIVSALKSYALKMKYKEVLLTSAPIIYEKKQNQNLDFALLWQGFNYQLHYISSAIKLNKDEDIIKRFQSTVRRNIRKTLNDHNIRVEVNENYEEFYPILIKNKARHSVKPTHTLDELSKLKSLLPRRLKLFMVYHQDIPIAGSLMFYPNETVALCFYNMLLYEYSKFKPIHRIMYEVVKDATKRNYKYVDIGVSQDTSAENPMTPSIKLIDFKEKFDAKAIMRNTFQIIL